MSTGFCVNHNASDNVHIKINGDNYAVNKRGLNIVIYSKKYKKVVDSVCFDTYANYDMRRYISFI